MIYYAVQKNLSSTYIGFWQDGRLSPSFSTCFSR